MVWQHLGAHGLRRRRRAAPLRHGDCGGRLQCGGLGDVVPTTLAWVNLHHDNDQTSYDVSVVDDFNLRSSAGSILACKSGYEAFRIDELCCRNMYNSPRTCRASKYSEFFKRECP
uniref:Uncharacterized protein n=1 Tax=Zea mays TaxID=4577 RepID=A0A804U801_MAIZE